MNVHTLWTGQSDPGLLEHLTLASFRRHGHKLTLWTLPELFGKARRLFPGLLIRDASSVYSMPFFLSARFGPRQTYQHYSDLFRMAVVLATGEWWTDLDVTLLRPLPILSADHAVAASAHDREGYSLSLFRCPKDFGPLRGALANAEKALKPPGNGEWMASARCFREAMGGELPDEILYCGDDSKWILEPLRHRSHGPIPSWPAIHWCGSSWPGSATPAEGSVYWRLLKEHHLI